MSLSASLSSALSGLTAAARGAEVVSSNVANARTAGYARRELLLAVRSPQGVQVAGVARMVDRALQTDRRAAQAAAENTDLRSAFLRRIEEAIGLPGDDGALSTRVGAFAAALTAAAGRPESTALLTAAVDMAAGIAGHLAAASGGIQTARAEADRAIAADVGLLNDSLARIADMNRQIRTTLGSGRDASALMDQRQQLVDGIAAIVPLREVDRGNGQIALYTAGGAVLLDGTPAEFGFTPAGIVVPGMTQGTGALSGLTLNGRAMGTAETGLLGGGRLAANFALRDVLGPEAQARLDAVARDLVERFADPALDPTLAPGAAGLFTDGGGPFAPGDETGLAARLAVNPALDGAAWRLRDGLGAAAPGASGQSALLVRMADTLDTARAPVSGGFGGGARSFAALASDLLSTLATARLTADGAATFSAAKAAALQQQEAAGGVDTDHEVQMLLQIETAYAANAKVLQSVDEMLDLLLGM